MRCAIRASEGASSILKRPFEMVRSSIDLQDDRRAVMEEIKRRGFEIQAHIKN